MKRMFVVVVSGLLFVLVLGTFSYACGMFVATAKNARGALYLGFGPCVGNATEMAMVKCSQDSFIPPSCKIVAVRQECPVPMCAPVCAPACAPMPMRRPIRKIHFPRACGFPHHCGWGRPMP
jgi:hypothetical protein